MLGSFVLGWINGFILGILLPFTCSGLGLNWDTWLLPTTMAIVSGMGTGPILFLLTTLTSVVMAPAKFSMPLLLFAAPMAFISYYTKQSNLLE